MAESSGHTLQVIDVYQTFEGADGNPVHALNGVSFTVEKPEVVGIVGPSGCGKSTLLRMIAGLDAPEAGQLIYDGEPITGPHYDRGLVFQDAALYDWLTVFDNIAFGLKARGLMKKGTPEAEANAKKVQDYIELMGLHGFENAYPYQISGGMASRTSLARTFVQDPGLILLDEPLSALDAFTRAVIQDEIVKMHLMSDAIFLLVTHDIEEAVYLCDRILVLSPRPGHIVGEIAVDLSHPRDRMSLAFVEKRKEVLGYFGG